MVPLAIISYDVLYVLLDMVSTLYVCLRSRAIASKAFVLLQFSPTCTRRPTSSSLTLLPPAASLSRRPRIATEALVIRAANVPALLRRSTAVPVAALPSEPSRVMRYAREHCRLCANNLKQTVDIVEGAGAMGVMLRCGILRSRPCTRT